MTNLVRIGKCYSGLLSRRRMYQRLAITTPEALKRFDNSPGLQRTIMHIESREPEDPEILVRNGLAGRVYAEEVFTSVGIYCQDPPESRAYEAEIYEEAERLFRSLAAGIHRRLFFKKEGITASPAIDGLPSNLYAALLAKLRDRFQERAFRNIAAIDVKSLPFDVIERSENGKKIIFSYSGLEQYTRWAHIEEDT